MPALETNYHPQKDQNLIASQDVSVTHGNENAITAELTELEDKNQQTLCFNSIKHTSIRGSECDELGLEKHTNVNAPGDSLDRSTNDAQGGEDLQRRIERLGRERPKQFKTLWAEVAFVFSIAMSQVLSVSTSLLATCLYLTVIGILRLWLYSRAPLCRYRSRHASRINYLACLSLFPRHRCISADIWPSRGHVRWLSVVCRRNGVAGAVEFDMWVRPE